MPERRNDSLPTFHETLLDSIGEAVLVTDRAGQVRLANRLAERLLHQPRTLLSGQSLGDLLQPPTDAPEWWRDALAELDVVRAPDAAAEWPVRCRLVAAPPLRLRLAAVTLDAEPSVVATLCEAAAEPLPLQRPAIEVPWGEAVIDLAADGILVIDAEHRLTRFSRGAEKLFGYGAAEVIGQPLDLLLPEAARERHWQLVRNFDESPRDHMMMGERLAVSARRKDGTIFPVEVSISRTGEGAQRAYIAVMRDVSQRVAAERALRDSERLFRSIFEQTARMIWLLELDGTIVQANQPALHAGGLTEDSAAGTDFLALAWHDRTAIDDDAAPGRIAELLTAAAAGTPAHGEVALRDGDGTVRLLDLLLKPVIGDDGGAFAILTEATDATERLAADIALRKSQANLANAQRIAHMGSWELDLVSGELIWSDETYRLFGVARDDDRDQPTFWDHVHPDDRLSVQQAVNQLLDGSGPNHFEHRVLLPDGSVRHVQQQAEVIRDDSDQPLRMTGTVQDITERKASEDSLRRAKIEAEQASKSKSEFLAHMSHELRTPLNAVIGFSAVLEGEMFGPLGSKYLEYAADIRRSGEHLLRIIGDILEMARLEAGHITLDESLVDVGGLVESAIAEIREGAESAQLDLFVTVTPNLPLIRADRARLHISLVNLLSNAVKFTPPGGMVAILASADDDGATRIQISDNGIGMTQSEVARVLEPFGQIQSSLVRSSEGIGLGLPLVRSLVALHGGELQIDSAPGDGTVVTILLPPQRAAVPQQV